MADAISPWRSQRSEDLRWSTGTLADTTITAPARDEVWLRDVRIEAGVERVARMALSRESRDGYEQWWARAECRTREANNVWLPSQCAHHPRWPLSICATT